MGLIRISLAGFKAGPVQSFNDFADYVYVSRLANLAAAESPDILVFPELLTFELLNSNDVYSQNFRFCLTREF